MDAAARNSTSRFRAASELLASVHDIITDRPFGAMPPRWSERRGWSEWLANRSDAEVAHAERDGLAAILRSSTDAPNDLADLARVSTEIADLPVSHGTPRGLVARAHISERKRRQVASFAALVGALPARHARIVDVGSGHGHLTRHLAESLGIAAQGWERDAARVATATSLARGSNTTFHCIDVLRDPPALTVRDLVVGLHCCGDLGDRAVRIACDANGSIAIIGCCPQKRIGDRAPLTDIDGVASSQLTLPHAALGLANVRDGGDGIEADLATRIRSRVHRFALHALLDARGIILAPGEEMRGVNRRTATLDFEALVSKAFSVRSLPAPSATIVRAADRSAWERYARIRRWMLPRDMLARVVEVWVALDRAAYLEAHGYACDVTIAFDRETSPRNVAMVGAPRF